VATGDQADQQALDQRALADDDHFDFLEEWAEAFALDANLASDFGDVGSHDAPGSWIRQRGEATSRIAEGQANSDDNDSD
jgi:hypothetical protein